MQPSCFDALPLKIFLKNKIAVLAWHDAEPCSCNVLPSCFGKNGYPFALSGLRYPCSSLLQKWTNLQRHLAVSRSDGKTSSAMVGCLRTLGDLRAAFLWVMFNV